MSFDRYCGRVPDAAEDEANRAIAEPHDHIVILRSDHPQWDRLREDVEAEEGIHIVELTDTVEVVEQVRRLQPMTILLAATGEYALVPLARTLRKASPQSVIFVFATVLTEDLLEARRRRVLNGVMLWNA